MQVIVMLRHNNNNDLLRVNQTVKTTCYWLLHRKKQMNKVETLPVEYCSTVVKNICFFVVQHATCNSMKTCDIWHVHVETLNAV